MKNTIPGNSKTVVPTIVNTHDEVLVDMTRKLGIVCSNGYDNTKLVSAIKCLEASRISLNLANGSNKDMEKPIDYMNDDDVRDFLSDSEDEKTPGLYASLEKAKLLHSCGKILKLCSPVCRVELAKKGGGPPKKTIIMLGIFWNCRGLGRPDKQKFLRDMIFDLVI